MDRPERGPFCCVIILGWVSRSPPLQPSTRMECWPGSSRVLYPTDHATRYRDGRILVGLCATLAEIPAWALRVAPLFQFRSIEIPLGQIAS